MNLNINPNCSITLEAQADDMEMLENIQQRCEGDDARFLIELLDETGWTPNGKLFFVRPEHLGALTDAPILTDELEVDDEGKPVRFGRVWWYPQYEHKDCAQELISKGKVTFAGCPA